MIASSVSLFRGREVIGTLAAQLFVAAHRSRARLTGLPITQPAGRLHPSAAFVVSSSFMRIVRSTGRQHHHHHGMGGRAVS